MFVSGILMASTNLLFSLLAWSGKSELLFAIAVIFDDMAAAFATVAFVAFISMLVDRTYTATQYALLASIGTAGRTTLASSSGHCHPHACAAMGCHPEILSGTALTLTRQDCALRCCTIQRLHNPTPPSMA